MNKESSKMNLDSSNMFKEDNSFNKNWSIKNFKKSPIIQKEEMERMSFIYESNNEECLTMKKMKEDENIESSICKDEIQKPLQLKKIFVSKLSKIDSINESEKSSNNNFTVKQDLNEKKETQNLAPNIQIIDFAKEEFEKEISVIADNNKGNESKEAKTIIESDNQNVANIKSAHDIKNNNFIEIEGLNNPLTPENSIPSNNNISSEIIINSRKASLENNINETKIREEVTLFRILKNKLGDSKMRIQNLKRSINEIRELLASEQANYLKFKDFKEEEEEEEEEVKDIFKKNMNKNYIKRINGF